MISNVKKKQECFSIIFSGHHSITHLNKNRLAFLTIWKGTTETNTRNFFPENKLAPDNYWRNTIKAPSEIPSTMGIFCSSAKLLQLLNNFVVNIEDFKIE